MEVLLQGKDNHQDTNLVDPCKCNENRGLSRYDLGRKSYLDCCVVKISVNYSESDIEIIQSPCP